MIIDPAKTYHATMVTSKGTMELLLDKLSKTRSNGEFLAAMSG